MGDDLGFKTGTLLSPGAVIGNVVPQYRRVIELVKKAGKPFLLHSCGNIFAVMDEIIAAGINAKHSNEDAISAFDKWIELYGDKIGLFGGFDVDLICQRPADEVFDYVVEYGTKYRRAANGYALGSGNSIPEYVPVEGYLAMIRAAQKIRENEA
jgi:uroporphyrinogen decarboxylase